MYPSRKHIFAQGLPKNQQKKKQPFGPLGPLAPEPPATPQAPQASPLMPKPDTPFGFMKGNQYVQSDYPTPLQAMANMAHQYQGNAAAYDSMAQQGQTSLGAANPNPLLAAAEFAQMAANDQASAGSVFNNMAGRFTGPLTPQTEVPKTSPLTDRLKYLKGVGSADSVPVGVNPDAYGKWREGDSNYTPLGTMVLAGQGAAPQLKGTYGNLEQNVRRLADRFGVEVPESVYDSAEREPLREFLAMGQAARRNEIQQNREAQRARSAERTGLLRQMMGGTPMDAASRARLMGGGPLAMGRGQAVNGPSYLNQPTSLQDKFAKQEQALSAAQRMFNENAGFFESIGVDPASNYYSVFRTIQDAQNDSDWTGEDDKTLRAFVNALSTSAPDDFWRLGPLGLIAPEQLQHATDYVKAYLEGKELPVFKAGPLSQGGTDSVPLKYVDPYGGMGTEFMH